MFYQVELDLGDLQVENKAGLRYDGTIVRLFEFSTTLLCLEQ